MHICHVNLAATYRGGERQTEVLIRELAKRGHHQRLVIRNGQELKSRAEDVENLEIVSVSSNALSAGVACKGTRIVQAHEARAVYSGWFASWRYKIPSVITRRVVRPQRPSWVRDRAFNRAGAVVAISEAVAQQIKVRYPLLSPVVVPDAHASLPVDAEVSNALRERYAGKMLIGHVGTYVHSAKGQLTIIEAAKRAEIERPDWHFLLLGAGKDQELFRECIGDLTNIELVGWVDNVGDYLAAFDIFVFPSLHEAMGSSVLDAMSFGLPVVATRVGGLPEVVEHGVNGVLVEPESPDQLFAGTAKLIDDEALNAAIHLANRKRAAEFGAEQMTDRYEALYRSLL